MGLKNLVKSVKQRVAGILILFFVFSACTDKETGVSKNQLNNTFMGIFDFLKKKPVLQDQSISSNLSDDLVKEITAEVIQEVKFGFYDQEDIEGIIWDMFYEEDIDEEWLRKLISQCYENQEREAAQWDAPTDFEKLRNVFEQLNKEKIIALHRTGYTQSDGFDDVREVAQGIQEQQITPIGYCFYHTQDLIRVIETNHLYLTFGTCNEEKYSAIQIGEKIISALKQQGFETERDET